MKDKNSASKTKAARSVSVEVAPIKPERCYRTTLFPNRVKQVAPKCLILLRNSLSQDLVWLEQIVPK